MTAHQQRHRRLQGAKIQPAADRQHHSQIEVPGLRQILVEQPALDRGQRQRPGLGQRPGRRTHGVRQQSQLGDRRMPEDLPGGQLQTGLRGPGADLDAEDRVAAQLEEIVVRAHSRQAEHRGPDRGQEALGGGARRDEIRILRRPLGRRQRPAVQLAIRGDRQRGQRDVRAGDHVLGEALEQEGPQLAGGGGGTRGGHEVRHQPPVAGPVLAHHHHRVPHAGVAEEGRLDLPRLDSEAAHLDLLIDAAEELHTAVRPEAGAVARAVEAVSRTAERVGDEALGGERGPPEIAAGDPRAADEELRRQPDGDRAVAGVEDVNAAARDRPADRQVEVVRQPVDGVGDRGLGEAEDVEERHAEAAPDRQALRGRLVAADEQEAQRGGGRAARQRELMDPLVPIRGRQLDAGDPMVADHRFEPCRRGQHVRIGEHHGTAREPGRDQLLDQHVEAGRGELEDAIVSAEAEPRDHVGRVRGQGAVGGHHPLGQTRRAGGVDDVGEPRRTGLSGGVPVFRHRRRASAVEAEDAAVGSIQLRQEPLAGHHQRRVRVRQQVGEALGRVGGIERQESASRAQHRQQGGRQLGGSLQADPHQNLGTGPQLAQAVGQAIGSKEKLPIGERALRADHGWGCGPAHRDPLDEPVDRQGGNLARPPRAPLGEQLVPLAGGQGGEIGEAGVRVRRDPPEQGPQVRGGAGRGVRVDADAVVGDLQPQLHPRHCGHRNRVAGPLVDPDSRHPDIGARRFE